MTEYIEISQGILFVAQRITQIKPAIIREFNFADFMI